MIGLNRRLRIGKRNAVDVERPYSPEKGFVHKGRVKCRMCGGEGAFAGLDCLACEGKGKVDVGCGGSAEIERNYGLAYCWTCGGFVAASEVSRA